uniref:Uncharacterized protein n=1 Tax=Oryza nivara TaxID=4536 RepID=A0A0E0IJV8_ORYNI
MRQCRTTLLVRHHANWRRVSSCRPREPRLSGFWLEPSRTSPSRRPQLEVNRRSNLIWRRRRLLLLLKRRRRTVKALLLSSDLSPPYSGRRRVGARPRDASGTAAADRQAGSRASERGRDGAAARAASSRSSRAAAAP